jgi:hypothetical protein
MEVLTCTVVSVTIVCGDGISSRQLSTGVEGGKVNPRFTNGALSTQQEPLSDCCKTRSGRYGIIH